MAESVSTFLPVGSAPQDIPLTDQNGDSVKLSDYRGQKLVLYFYPKDGSGSCLKEALSLRDGYDKLKAKGYEVVGVSPDSEKSHLNFITKQSLPFRLISDPETKLIQQFGAWGEKSMYGRSYMGLLRSTFLLNEEGVVTHVIENVVTAAHATQILDLLES
ncbi:MAG: peroxiredoxin [Bacteroidia bacterium]|nr:peroxiredoxin [Bacteroidia bacterium]